MPYISKSNASRIVQMIDFNNTKIFEGTLYNKNIAIFHKKDRNRLLALSELYSDPQKFLDSRYAQIKNVDTLSYVFEGSQSAYHSNKECPKLNTTFYNFKIPEEIIEKGAEEVKKFRNWFKANQSLLTNHQVFEMRMTAAFGVRQSLKQIEHQPSGIQKIENLNLENLEAEIDNLLNEIQEYYEKADAKTRRVIDTFQKNASIGYMKEPIKDRIGFTDRALKEFLVKYNEAFKVPLKKLLMEYYRIKSNPLLAFEGNILEQLGFRPCSVCHQA